MLAFPVPKELVKPYLNFINSWNQYTYVLIQIIEKHNQLIDMFQLQVILKLQYKKLNESSNELHLLLKKNSL
jgi:hypothetical protein